MGDFPHYFDIILFAMVAAFLVLRLRSVLGRRTGNERRRDPMLRRAEAPGDKIGDKVVALGNRGAAAAASGHRAARRMPSRRVWSESAPPIRVSIRRSFSKGARAAFEMIVAAFAAGDKARLAAAA